MIALRATHTAHRVACELLYAPLPKLPTGVLPLTEDFPKRREPVVPVDEILARANAIPPKRRIRSEIVVAVWLTFWMVALVVLYVVLR